MSTALLAPTIPDDDTVPASRIMREREDYKERWARELSRAEALERQLRECRDARDAARQTCDDLTAHSVSQGDYIKRLSDDLQHAHASWAAEVASDIARIVAAENALADERMLMDRMAAENARLRTHIGHLVDWIESTGSGRDELEELGQKIGNECGTCEGRGEHGYSDFVGYSGPTNACREVVTVDTCDDCKGVGWRLR